MNHPTPDLTLAEFLLARIAEDEAAARSAIHPERPGTHWQWVRNDDDVVIAAPTWEDGSISLRTVEEFPTTYGVGGLPAFVINHVEVDEPRALPHIARHDPACVLAGCEAKRQIAETLADMETLPADERVEQRVTLRWVCELHALVYADHPDYRDEWKP